MEIKEFWVVTKPTEHSELGDICFQTTARGLALQFRGGLDPESIVGLFSDEDEAEHRAFELLKIENSGHTKDEDCFLDNPDGPPGMCVECGVWHDIPCIECGGTGFHKDGCKLIGVQP